MAKSSRAEGLLSLPVDSRNLGPKILSSMIILSVRRVPSEFICKIFALSVADKALQYRATQPRGGLAPSTARGGGMRSHIHLSGSTSPSPRQHAKCYGNPRCPKLGLNSSGQPLRHWVFPGESKYGSRSPFSGLGPSSLQSMAYRVFPRRSVPTCAGLAAPCEWPIGTIGIGKPWLYHLPRRFHSAPKLREVILTE